MKSRLDELPEAVGATRREAHSLKQENNLLRDRVAEMSRELEGRPPGGMDALEHECQRLRAELFEKDRDHDRQIDQMRSMLQDRDGVTNKQKNEWAEIYGNMKREAEDLKRDVRMLNSENERLVRQVEMNKQSAGRGGATDIENSKRLKKRELECQALWETLKDMYHGDKRVYDKSQMLDILSVRALDTKAKRKLSIR